MARKVHALSFFFFFFCSLAAKGRCTRSTLRGHKSSERDDEEPAQVVSRSGIKGHALRWQSFNADDDEWCPAEITAGQGGGGATTFSLLSFNVWFAPHRQLTRAEELLRTIARLGSDVVCLQEATPRLLRVLLADPFVRATYCVSSTQDEFETLTQNCGYDSYMLARPAQCGKLFRYRLSSKFARCLYLNLGPQFAVSTIHLESCPENAHTRAVQMEQIYGLLEEHGVGSKAFFCGDLNHCPSQGENHLRDSSIDVWPFLHPNDPGWSENKDINLMMASKPGQHPLVRFDRIVMTGKFGFEPKEIRLLGTEPIQQMSHHKEAVELTLSEQTFISDHFGLFAKFVKNN